MPWQSTLDFVVRPTGIDVQMYLACDSADILVANENERVAIDRDNFGDYESRLATIAPTLLLVTQADGTVLTADASSATFTDEGDTCFHLHYPLPAVLPGALAIHGNYLSKMDLDHNGEISVLNAAGEQLGQGTIRDESPDYRVQLPAVGAPRQPATVAAAAAPSSSDFHWGLWAVLGGTVLVISVIALRAMAKANVEGKNHS
jgi:hypothetical protein